MMELVRKFVTEVYVPHGGWVVIHHNLDTYGVIVEAFWTKKPFVGVAIPIATICQVTEDMIKISMSGWVLRGVTQESQGYLEWEEGGDVTLRVVVTG